jgi:hypothetical protein
LFHERTRNVRLEGRRRQDAGGERSSNAGWTWWSVAEGDHRWWRQALAAGSREVGGGAKERRSERSLASLACLGRVSR